ncbi:bifunctional protein FolD 1, mitochondrial-like isoform X2 [Quercus robur]|uniref:bifunctional protein FolD 1, mitochondrial-like isoform X2 n=1 Tax=Quercus robur TaxID=38942 RepID=UPI00216198F4|nr:bifunctional protein FolD 1, mitochondrial-like isoform X2 [Quercus robur]
MRGGNWVGVVGRRLRKKTSYSSVHSTSSTPTEYPNILGPNLPDVWTPTNQSHRPQSSAIFSNGNSARIIDGKPIAKDIKFRIAGEIQRMKAAIGKSPGLAVVLVGQRRDSKTYINIKLRACDEVGIATMVEELPESCTESELLDVVSRFNEDPSVHGIIVQLPLPQHLDEEKIMTVVSPEKDVDGFHPLNMGNLALRGRQPFFIPCAPKGCIELLLRFGVQISGKRSVVIGRSKIVGLPTALLLQRHHATVSTVHSFTKNPEQITSQADIVVSDVGIPNLVQGNWLKPGSVVIDMGTNLVKL